jgi:hypothetical protein
LLDEAYLAVELDLASAVHDLQYWGRPHSPLPHRMRQSLRRMARLLQSLSSELRTKPGKIEAARVLGRALIPPKTPK